jgi:hypothetical protein
MPEAAVYEHGQLFAGDNKVGTTWKVGALGLESNARRS